MREPQAAHRRKQASRSFRWLIGALLICAAALLSTLWVLNSEPSSQPGIGSTRVRTEDSAVMVFVPGGDFLMGSEENEDEQPIHPVSLDAYWIDRTEVTKEMYARCVEAGGCGSNGQDNPDVEAKAGSTPVLYTAWADAQAYCAWAGARLPTEAEWERAARGSDGRPYPWGSAAPDCSLANFFYLGGACIGEVSPVGSLPGGAGPYGTLDMAGNVWEWVSDWYGAGYYANSPVEDPQGPESGIYRVIRGGSWATSAGEPRHGAATGRRPPAGTTTSASARGGRLSGA